MATFNYKIVGKELDQEDVENVVPKTLWQKIFLYLTKSGYEVYSPGQKRDKCEATYVVIKENGIHGQDGGNELGFKVFDIIVYCPLTNYSDMEFYAENIKQALKEMKELRPTGVETPSIIDDEVEGYTSSIEYQALKTLRRR
ncbi:hypothetical protein [Clostridium estertheticum]|uniref:hypothetical protein n=1 Tax=Clostridium estertheticum TaxID=238834 RepID=UPI001C0C1962|nr:hypothetical protein [Clostridium estertheticum]MBU3185657.1 hypothetical protein [Clostridium estertheticum]